MDIFFPNASIAYPPQRGGEIHRYQLIKNLSELGHQIHTLLPDENPYAHHHAKKALHVVPALRRADVLYCRVEESPNAATRMSLPSRRWLIPRKCALVWEINISLTGSASQRGRNDEQVRQHLAELRASAQRLDGCICVTSAIASQVKTLLGFDSPIVIPNASDPEMFQPDLPVAEDMAYDRSKLHVVSIGSGTNPYHDMSLIAQTAALINERRLPIQIHIFGASEQLLESMTNESLITHGPVSYLELPRHLAAMDVGLVLYNIPGDHNSPLKLFDYLASGCVPICSIGQPVQEVLNETNAGLVADWSPDSLVAALLRLHSNRDELIAMRNVGRKLIENNYNWRRVAERTVDVLEQAILKRRQ